MVKQIKYKGKLYQLCDADPSQEIRETFLKFRNTKAYKNLKKDEIAKVILPVLKKHNLTHLLSYWVNEMDKLQRVTQNTGTLLGGK